VELTIDELTALVLEHGRLAMLYRKTAAEHDKLAQVYLEAGKRFNRQEEEQESKMNIRKIISGVSMVLLVVFLIGSLNLTMAQGEPEATAAVTASVNGNPVEATLEPVDKSTPVDQTPSLLNIVLDKLIIIAAIIGLIVLALKVAGTVPKETFDSAIEKGFSLAKEITLSTATPIDDAALELFKPGLTKWLDDEFAKRAGVVQVNVQAGTKEDISAGGGILAEELRRRGINGAP